jgi:hypothetical protein
MAGKYEVVNDMGPGNLGPDTSVSVSANIAYVMV